MTITWCITPLRPWSAEYTVTANIAHHYLIHFLLCVHDQLNKLSPQILRLLPQNLFSWFLFSWFLQIIQLLLPQNLFLGFSFLGFSKSYSYCTWLRLLPQNLFLGFSKSYSYCTCFLLVSWLLISQLVSPNRKAIALAFSQSFLWL